MSKIKMLLDVVQDMRRLTDSLETLARAIEGPEEEQSATSEKPAEAKQPTTAQRQPTVQGQSAEPQQSAEQPPSAPVAATSAPDAPKPPTLVENYAPLWRSAPRRKRGPKYARCWPATAWPSSPSCRKVHTST